MASYPSSSHYTSSSTELSLSSSAQALYFASKPHSRPHSGHSSTRDMQHQHQDQHQHQHQQHQHPPGSHWDDTDDDHSASGPWDDGPEQSRWSSATGSQRASRLSSSSRGNSYSRSKFSDEDTSAYGSDEDRYGPPDDAKQRSSGYSSDKGDRGSLSGASSYATAATSADQLDSSSLLDDRPARFYRQSAREAEAYRHLSALRRPSPIPTDLPYSSPPPSRSPLPQGAQNPAAALAPPSSPATSPTMPLNIIKKSGTSPASPDFGPIPVPQPPLNRAALNGMTSGTPPLTDASTFLSSSHAASDPASGGARASNAPSSTGTRSSNAYSTSSGAGGVYRTSTLSQPPQPTRSSNISPPSMQRQPSSDHFFARQQLQQRQQNASMPDRRMSVDSEYSDAASEPEEVQDHEEKTAGSDSDDNVPLAQRLPNALKAQQSIRAKDKQDRQRRRAERAARKATATAAVPSLPPSVQAQRAVSAPMQGAPSQSNGTAPRQRQASQPLSSVSAFSPPRAMKTLPPTQHQLNSQNEFADDLTRRLAQVQSTNSSAPEEPHFGVALALDNTGSSYPRSPPATQGAFPAAARAPPPDAFRSHAELQLRRQSSQPHLSRHSRLSSRGSIDSREREKDAPAMRPPSPGAGNAFASPDAKLRAYAAGGSASLSRAGSVSARGTYVIPPPRPESRSRPPSPPPPASQSQPVQPARIMPTARSRAPSPARRPTTADGERHRPTELRRPMTADRDAEPRPFGSGAVAISRPGSPVLRPPSPSMSSLTPDERLKQLAMSRRRTVSVSQQQQQRPAESMPAVPQLPLERISPPAQSELPASPRPGAQERVAFPPPPNGPLSQSLSRATATSAQKDAGLGIRPPSPSMATLTPDERLRQIAMSRGRGPAPAAPAQPAATSSSLPFRKRAMSLGRPSAKEEAAPARAKTLLSKSRGAHSNAATPMPPIPQSPLPPTVKMAQNQKPVIVTDAMGATQKVLAADVGPATRAKDVLTQLASQLPTGSQQGWMLYEMCNDLGLERPIREFELVAECCARWPAEGNTFAVRQTRLSRSLAQSAIPSVAPFHGAYVDFEVKRGKWSKRWLELRENCLWVSKKEHAKDAAFLCSLSNFDVYSVTRATVKPPRYAFTLRSTDDLSMFENPADSIHGFCSPDAREGERWIENIMVARSCVLAQERTVLFRTREPASTAPSSNSRSRPPAAPLLNVRALAQAAGVLSPSPVSASSPRVPDMRFEPGSLLARAAAAERV